MVMCLGRGADLHMAQLMRLPLTISSSSKSRLVLPFWYQLTWVVPDKGPLNRCCVTVVHNIHVIINHATAMEKQPLNTGVWNVNWSCAVSVTWSVPTLIFDTGCNFLITTCYYQETSTCISACILNNTSVRGLIMETTVHKILWHEN